MVMRRLVLMLALLALAVSASAQDLRLPLKEGSVRFAIIGDPGTGTKSQFAVAKQLETYRQKFPFTFVIMTGDNIYGTDSSSAFLKKFEQPYRPLLDAGVKFYAALGNHDDPKQRLYKPFNMNGERYHTFKFASVRFFAIDSNYVDPVQLAWLEKELAASGSDWKIPYFHHPLYSSSAKRGPNAVLREQLEPLFLKYGVTVVFTGHEHFYERTKPQKGITYFIQGSSAKLRRGDLRDTPLTAKGYDDGYAFMLVEIAGDEMYFQTITDKGQAVDSGIIRRIDPPKESSRATNQPRTQTPAAR